jgi:DNA-binding protein YbaB
LEPEELLEAYRARVADIAERAQAVRAEIANVRGTATSSNGAVSVAVSVHGALEDLSFGPGAELMPLPDLAAEILRTSRKARLRAASAGADALVPLIGANGVLPEEAPPDPFGTA